MIDKEKIAISAANEWCRCFKCDGRVNATGCACEKDKKLTCLKWYDGFRTAMLALNDYEQQIMNNAVECTVYEDAGGYPYINEIELYDYDKEEPLAKAGNKVKVAIIKED